MDETTNKENSEQAAPAKGLADRPAKRLADAPAKGLADAPTGLTDAPAKGLTDAPAKRLADAPAKRLADAPATAMPPPTPPTPSEEGGQQSELVGTTAPAALPPHPPRYTKPTAAREKQQTEQQQQHQRVLAQGQRVQLTRPARWAAVAKVQVRAKEGAAKVGMPDAERQANLARAKEMRAVNKARRRRSAVGAQEAAEQAACARQEAEADEAKRLAEAKRLEAAQKENQAALVCARQRAADGRARQKVIAGAHQERVKRHAAASKADRMAEEVAQLNEELVAAKETAEADAAAASAAAAALEALAHQHTAALEAIRREHAAEMAERVEKAQQEKEDAVVAVTVACDAKMAAQQQQLDTAMAELNAKAEEIALLTASQAKGVAEEEEEDGIVDSSIGAFLTPSEKTDESPSYVHAALAGSGAFGDVVESYQMNSDQRSKIEVLVTRADQLTAKATHATKKVREMCVRIVEEVKGSAERVAIKVFDPKQDGEIADETEEAQLERAGTMYEKEKAMMLRLRDISHENIIAYFGHVDADRAIILEYVQGGDLYDAIGLASKEFSGFSEKLTLKIMLQLLQAVSHLHTHDIVHLDLKPQNILVRGSRDALLQMPDTVDGASSIVLADYGIALALEDMPPDGAPQCGTTTYMSPEMNALRNVKNPKASDMWSTAVIGSEMLTSRPLYANVPNDDVAGLIITFGDLIDDDDDDDDDADVDYLYDFEGMPSEAPWYDEECIQRPGFSHGVTQLLYDLTKPKPVDRLTAADALPRVKALLMTAIEADGEA